MSSAEAAAPKASGLKPPSKISRGCSVTPKPSLPIAATPRSANNASIVLTEDTDSFIIGDKVWVGGTKPGQIAYIGETQFAPGEWAGVVLDEPIGKNDGSVAGIRYFQCEPKKGVFSRLTRLTREPIGQADTTSVSGEPNPNMSTRSPSSHSHYSLSSPAGSVKDLMLKKASTPPTHGSAVSDLKIGERVIVMSSLGSKAGVLRYKGTTDFAAGEWCGVELDDPVGKNDGSVGDRRYFECQPKCGLFAPVHKVSRSPASRRTSSCLVHRSNTPSSGIRRAGSRESVTSISSSVASSVRSARVRLGVTSLGPISQRSITQTSPAPARSTLKDTLKEKELQIEKLLKERDLERAEITRAASQADEAEQKLANLKLEFQKFCQVSEVKHKELDDLLTQIHGEKTDLLSQLEDERKKVEDLQFQFEEEKIYKADIQLAKKALEEAIQLLEQRLSEEHKKCEVLEQDSNKLFEAEEALAHYKEEVELSKKLLNESQLKASENTSEIEVLKREISDLRRKYEESKEENLKIEEVYSSKLEVLQKDLEGNKLAFDESGKQARETLDRCLEEKSEELKHTLSALKEKEAKVNELKQEVEAAQTSIQGLKKEVEVTLNSSNQRQNELLKVVEEKETVLLLREEEFKHATENYMQQAVEQDSIRLKLEEDIKEKDLEILTLKNESETLRNSSEEMKQTHMAEIKEGESQIHDLKAIIKEKDAQFQQLTALSAQLELELQTKTDLVKNLDDHKIGLSDKLVAAEQSVCGLTTQIHSLELELGDTQRKLQAFQEKCEQVTQQKQKLENDISDLMSTSVDSSSQLSKLNSELRLKEEELERTREIVTASSQEIERTKQKLQQVSEQSTKTKEDLNNKLTIYEGNLNRLQLELKTEKSSKLEVQQELEKISEAKKKLEEEMKHNHEQMTKEIGANQLEFCSKLELVAKEKNELIAMIETLKHEQGDKEVQVTHQIETLVQKLQVAEAELMKRSTEMTSFEEVHRKRMEEMLKDKLDVEEKLQEEITILKQKLTSADVHASKQQELISVLNKQEDTENDLKSKMNELNEKLEIYQRENAALKNIVEETGKGRDSLHDEKMRLEKDKDGLILELKEENCKLVSMEKAISILKEEKVNTEMELSLVKEKVAVLSKELQLGKEFAEQSQMSAADKEKQIVQLHEELSTLHEQKIMVENSLHDLVAQVSTLTEEKLTAEKLASERNEKLNSLTKEMSDLREDYGKHNNELQTQLEETQKGTKVVHELQKNLDTLQEELKKTEAEKSNLANYCSSLEVKLQATEHLASGMDLLEKKVKTLQDSHEEQNSEILTHIETEKAMSFDIAQKNKQYERLLAEVQSGQEKEKHYKSTITSLERELATARQAPGGAQDTSFESSERDFLNSIIAEQQRQIKELNAHLELLNRGFTPSDAKDLLLEGIVERVVAPRSYCDICEVFDAHETEDCPRQATDSPPPQVKHKPGTRPELTERPYCEICEVFGHSTADCDDTETF